MMTSISQDNLQHRTPTYEENKERKQRKFVIHVAVTGDLDDEDNADDLSDSKCDRRRNFGRRRLGRDEVKKNAIE